MARGSGDSLFEIPILDDVSRKNMSLVRMAGGAAELAKVEAESENQSFLLALVQKCWKV